MPIFARIDYTRHALERMDERTTWIYEFGPWRVVTVEDDDMARIIIVVRLRGRA